MRRTMEWVAVLTILALVSACSRGGLGIWLVKGPEGSVYFFSKVHGTKKDVAWRAAKDWRRGLEIVELEKGDGDERQ